jgi:hypothetical protein
VIKRGKGERSSGIFIGLSTGWKPVPPKKSDKEIFFMKWWAVLTLRKYKLITDY